MRKYGTYYEYLGVQNKLCGPSIVQQPETCQKPTNNQPQCTGFCEKDQIYGIFSTILIHNRAENINDLLILTEITRGVDGFTAKLGWVFGCYIVDRPQGICT